MGHSKAPEPSTRLLSAPAPTAHTQLPTPARPLALGTARGGREQRLLPGRGGLHARAGAALGPFGVAHSSEWTDEQERYMHGNWTEGRSQGSRADAGARSGTLQRLQ
jgi:hypothetical protein